MTRAGARYVIAILGCLVAGVPAVEAQVIETRHYELHSDPWMNLHHFLYQWSRDEVATAAGRAPAVEVPEVEAVDRLSSQDRSSWESATAFYRDNVAELGHFDEAMLVFKAALLDMDSDPTRRAPDTIEGISEQLAAAMPVYLRSWWPEHDAVNRGWIDRVEDDLRTYEGRWVETVSRAFGGAWLPGRLRVDVTSYGNFAAGYTSNGPAHTVIWTSDPTNHEGLYGLEILFHESGHMSTLGGPFRRTVRAMFEEAGMSEPANLRHAMLFGTAGEVTRAIGEEKGLPEHAPYVIREGLTDLRGWAPVWPLVEEYWLPVVRGETSREAGLEAIVRAAANR